MFGWLKRWIYGSPAVADENPVPDGPNLQQQEPEPQVAEVAPPPPALTPLMQRVKAAQDANDINELRRLRWCFHEAAHAIVAHYYKAAVEKIVVNNANGRPYASINKKLLQDLAEAVKVHGAGSPQALAAVLPFFAQYTSGELLEQEAQIVQPILSIRVDEVGWAAQFDDPTKFDIRMIIVMGRDAGFNNRTDLVKAGEDKAMEIITEKRAAFEALINHLLDNGNIESQPLQAILDM